jgi:hypothetical protein
MDLKGLFKPEEHQYLELVTPPVKKIETPDLGYGLASQYKYSIVVKDRIVYMGSEDYQLIPNEWVLEKLARLFQEANIPYAFRADASRGTRFKMEFFIKDSALNMGTKKVNDIVGGCIRVINSYDGTQRYSMSLSTMRLVCSNGMSVPDESLSKRFTHTPSLMDFSLSEEEKFVRDSLPSLQSYVEDAVMVYEDLQVIPVRESSVPIMIDWIIDQTKFPVGLRDGVISRLNHERALGLPLTRWLLYNAFNYMINHGNELLMGRKGNAIDRNILNLLLNE